MTHIMREKELKKIEDRLSQQRFYKIALSGKWKLPLYVKGTMTSYDQGTHLNLNDVLLFIERKDYNPKDKIHGYDKGVPGYLFLCQDGKIVWIEWIDISYIEEII